MKSGNLLLQVDLQRLRQAIQHQKQHETGTTNDFVDHLRTITQKAYDERNAVVHELLEAVVDNEQGVSRTPYGSKHADRQQEFMAMSVGSVKQLLKYCRDFPDLHKKMDSFVWKCTKYVKCEGFDSFRNQVVKPTSREPETAEPASPQDASYGKRIQRLRAQEEARVYDKMVENLRKDEERAKERDSFAGMQQQLSIGSSLFFGMFAAAGAGYYLGMFLQYSEEQRLILAVTFLVISLFVEMMIVIMRLSKLPV
eukprot:gb/GECG01010216.1/.p1 GENE.gb/GECG01010216.1/~~gb/GECG01010216.1/.p1  ORF type:complete len:254 (+),score=47.53 gb/GECG01010216.1/:1-762(+)